MTNELYKPSNLINWLKDHGIRPKKALSQNFLVDGNVLKKMVKTSEVKDEDIILEIGPGPGVFTQHLLNKNLKVIAVEKDNVFAKHLHSWNDPNLTVINNDFLELDLPNLLKTYSSKIKVIANIPYNITTPILIHLLSSYHLFSSITILVQKEVAERIVSSPCTKKYSSISVFIKTYTTASSSHEVSKNCYFPKPSVDTAILHLSIKEKIDFTNSEKELFHNFVRKAFGQRRKKLTSSLRSIYDPCLITKALTANNLDINIRPEDISYDNFINIFRIVTK
jgi:16S rRNA (adenine1518-N6/adenine1519-N6)-dimethyltransferase